MWDTEYNNNIWSGNIADGGPSYTYVQAYWTESCIPAGTNDHFSTWVGIGGNNNNNLVQTGVDGNNWNIFNQTYVAWVENLGANYNLNVFTAVRGKIEPLSLKSIRQSSAWEALVPDSHNGETIQERQKW